MTRSIKTTIFKMRNNKYVLQASSLQFNMFKINRQSKELHDFRLSPNIRTISIKRLWLIIIIKQLVKMINNLRKIMEIKIWKNRQNPHLKCLIIRIALLLNHQTSLKTILNFKTPLIFLKMSLNNKKPNQFMKNGNYVKSQRKSMEKQMKITNLNTL